MLLHLTQVIMKVRRKILDSHKVHGISQQIVRYAKTI